MTITQHGIIIFSLGDNKESRRRTTARACNLGHPVTHFMPGWISHERQDLMRCYGAEVVLVSPEQDGFRGSIRMSEESAASRSDVFWLVSFRTAPAQRLTRPRLPGDMGPTGVSWPPPGRFCGWSWHRRDGDGSRALPRARNPDIRVYPVEPSESPTISTGHKMGEHRIQGISDEFIPAFVDLTRLDRVIAVSDGDSILMAQKLASSLGLAVGISPRCNFLGALMVQ